MGEPLANADQVMVKYHFPPLKCEECGATKRLYIVILRIYDFVQIICEDCIGSFVYEDTAEKFEIKKLMFTFPNVWDVVVLGVINNGSRI